MREKGERENWCWLNSVCVGCDIGEFVMGTCLRNKRAVTWQPSTPQSDCAPTVIGQRRNRQNTRTGPVLTEVSGHATTSGSYTSSCVINPQNRTALYPTAEDLDTNVE